LMVSRKERAHKFPSSNDREKKGPGGSPVAIEGGGRRYRRLHGDREASIIEGRKRVRALGDNLSRGEKRVEVHQSVSLKRGGFHARRLNGEITLTVARSRQWAEGGSVPKHHAHHSKGEIGTMVGKKKGFITYCVPI